MVSDVMRAAVVLAVAAFDALLHGILRTYLVRAAAKEPVPQGLMNLIHEWKLKPHDIFKMAAAPNGITLLADRVDAHYSEQALQNPYKVEQMFRTLGITKVWNAIGTRLNVDHQTARDYFHEVVKLRNAIVHEADRKPLALRKTEQYRGRIVEIATALRDIVGEHFEPEPEREAKADAGNGRQAKRAEPESRDMVLPHVELNPPTRKRRGAE